LAGAAAQDLFERQTHALATFSDNYKIFKLIEAHGISEHDHGEALRDEAYNRARTILEANRDSVLKLVERFTENGRVDGPEFEFFMHNNAPQTG
jgi:hypothetical protein